MFGSHLGEPPLVDSNQHTSVTRDGIGALLRALRVWLFLVLLGAYLYTILTGIDRDPYSYNFIQLLFDYRYGMTRRGLEGEILRHIIAPPYDDRHFVRFALVQEALAALLFVAASGLAIRRKGSRALGLLIFAAATSPLVFKNYVRDYGRQDLLGLILAEALMILVLADLKSAARWLLAAAIVPLCLIADNQIFLFVPTCFVLTFVQWEPGKPPLSKGAWIALLACAVSISLSLCLPPPRVPESQYHAYLLSKWIGVKPPSFPPEHWIYAGVRENIALARHQLVARLPLHLAHAMDYAFFLAADAVVVAYAALSLRANRRAFIRYLTAALVVAAGYVPLFFLACDISRWFANFTTCTYLLAIYAMARFGDAAARASAVIAGLAVFQFVNHTSFGIISPDFDMVSRMTAFFSHALAAPWRLW